MLPNPNEVINRITPTLQALASKYAAEGESLQPIINRMVQGTLEKAARDPGFLKIKDESTPEQRDRRVINYAAWVGRSASVHKRRLTLRRCTGKPK